MLILAGQGLEPRLTAPEAVVLPLDDPAFYVLMSGSEAKIFKFMPTRTCLGTLTKNKLFPKYFLCPTPYIHRDFRKLRVLLRFAISH